MPLWRRLIQPLHNGILTKKRKSILGNPDPYHPKIEKRPRCHFCRRNCNEVRSTPKP